MPSEQKMVSKGSDRSNKPHFLVGMFLEESFPEIQSEEPEP